MDLMRLKTLNWIEVIKEKTARIIEEHKNDIDFMIRLTNGDYQMLAQEEFCFEKAQGVYDNINMRIPEYDRY